jgi:outer membrane protein
MKLVSIKAIQIVLVSSFTALISSSCGNQSTDKTKTNGSTSATSADHVSSGSKVAYVNLDSLETHYEYFKTRKESFEKKQTSMEAELERLAKNLQNEYAGFQRKAQAGTLTQAEGEAAQVKLERMQADIENRRQSLATQLMQEQEEFNKELQTRLDAFLEKYNQDKGYDFILSYIKGGNILFANKDLDITQDIIKGMNEEDKKTPSLKDTGTAQ